MAAGGRLARGRPCDDFRLVGLKLIFLIVTRAVSVLGFPPRCCGGIATLSAAAGHGCRAADTPDARRRAVMSGRWCCGWPVRMSRGATAASTASSWRSASRWGRQRSGRSSRRLMTGLCHRQLTTARARRQPSCAARVKRKEVRCTSSSRPARCGLAGWLPDWLPRGHGAEGSLVTGGLGADLLRVVRRRSPRPQGIALTCIDESAERKGRGRH